MQLNIILCVQHKVQDVHKLATAFITTPPLEQCTEVCGAVQAGGYFSLCVCLTTWWVALAELVFDVTGKVSLLHFSLQSSQLHFLHVHHAFCSSISPFLLLSCEYFAFIACVLLAIILHHLHLSGSSGVLLTHLCVVNAALCPCLLVPMGP